jgi:hypothetical protein
MTAGAAVTDEQIIAKLLHGLPKSYEAVVFSFESRPKEERTIDTLSRLLMRKEGFDNFDENIFCRQNGRSFTFNKLQSQKPQIRQQPRSRSSRSSKQQSGKHS